MAADELIIKIGAETSKFKSELDKVKGQVKDLEKGLATTAKISAAAFVGLATAAGLAVKSFAKFEDGFSDVVTLLDKSAFGAKKFEKGISEMKSGILDLGAATGESFDVLNKALFDTVSAGVDAGDSLEFLSAATELAVAGATDTSIAVDGMTSAMNAFGLDASQATEIAQKFFVAQVGGKTTVEEMASGFGKAGATANAYGVSLDELLGAISAVTLGGVKTSAAYTGFNAVLAGIAKPTKDAAEEAKRLGIEFTTTALRTQGLTGFLDTLRNANGFTQKSVEKLFGSVEAQKVAFALTGSQADAYASQIEALGNKQKLAGDFSAALAVKNATTAKAMAKLSQSTKALAITIGEQLAPSVNDIAKGLTSLVQKFSAMDESTKENIGTLVKWGLAVTGGIAALAAAGVAALKISAIIAALTAAFGPAALGASAFWLAITGPVGLAVAGIAAVSAGAYALFKVFEDPKEPQSLKDINNELDKLKEKEAKLAETAHINRVGQANRSQKRLEEIQEEIKELENLQQAGIKATEDFGDGILLIRPEVEQTSGNPAQDIVDKILGGQDSLKIPLSIEGQEDGAIEAKAKEQSDRMLAIAKDGEAKKTQATKDEAKERIKAAKRENVALREMNQAKNDGLTEQEISFIQKFQDLEDEKRQAKKIKDDEERSLELDHIDIQNEELLVKLEEFNIATAEADVLEKEGQAERQAEFLALTKSNDDLNDEQKRMRIAEFNSASTESQKKQNKVELEQSKQIAAKKKELNAQINNQLVSSAFAVASELVKVSGASAKEQFAIQKALGIAQVLINGYMAKHLTEATIPGPIGIAIGESQLLRAFISAGTIAATAGIQYSAMAQGGLAGAGRGGMRDKFPTMLEKDELIVPRAVAPDFIQAVGRPDISAEAEGGGNVQQIEIGFTENAFEIIERKQNEDVALGIREAN